jgi:phage shock protein C
MTQPKKLYRNTSDAVLFGVCSGIAEYIGVDATVVRIVYVLLTLFTVFIPGVLAYLIMWAMIPEKPRA